MADRLSWWVIPGALVVLARVVTLGGTPAAVAPAAPAGPEPAVAEAAQVQVRDASGRRAAVRPFAATTAGAFVIDLPDGFAGQRGELTIWRCQGGRAEASPWLACRAKVRADGTIPIAGLAAGDYALRLVIGAGEAAQTFATPAVAAPGRWTVAAAAPAR